MDDKDFWMEWSVIKDLRSWQGPVSFICLVFVILIMYLFMQKSGSSVFIMSTESSTAFDWRGNTRSPGGQEILIWEIVSVSKYVEASCTWASLFSHLTLLSCSNFYLFNWSNRVSEIWKNGCDDGFSVQLLAVGTSNAETKVYDSDQSNESYLLYFLFVIPHRSVEFFPIVIPNLLSWCDISFTCSSLRHRSLKRLTRQWKSH